MNLKEAVKDTNKALKTINELCYKDGFKYSYSFYKQGLRDIWYGTKQLLATIACLLVYLFLPIAYPLAVLIRIIKK